MSNADRRNPYLILGIDYGASKAEAAAGFARLVKRLRALDDAEFTIEDANWALHQVEQVQERPELAVHMYRAPADPSVFGGAEGAGILQPEPVPEPRHTKQCPPDFLEALRREALREVLLALAASVEKAPPVPAPFQIVWEEP